MRNGHETATPIAVVGGGLAGLTAAAYVARAGRQVTVLERTSRLGGRADTHDQRGFLFNLGPHALYAKGAAVDVLRELGVTFTGRKPPISGYFLHDGRLHALNPLALVTTSLLSAGGKLAAMRALASIYRTKPHSVANVPWSDWSRDHVSADDAGGLLRALMRVATYVNAPDQLSAEIALTQIQLSGRHGVLYLDGGWQTIVDGMRRAAEAAGARILTGATVERVEHDGRSVRGVRLADGSMVEASAVVIAVSPQVAAQHVPDSERLRLIADQSIPVRAACLDLGLRKLPLPKQRFSLGVDRPYYFSEHSGVARLAPDGQSLVQVAKYLAPDDDAPASVIERELETFVEIVQPGWREELVERRFLPNMVVVNALATAAGGGLKGRPPVDAAGITGLYLAGDWIGSEGWLSDASFASGKKAADLALRAAGAAEAGTLTAPVPA